MHASPLHSARCQALCVLCLSLGMGGCTGSALSSGGDSGTVHDGATSGQGMPSDMASRGDQGTPTDMLAAIDGATPGDMAQLHCRCGNGPACQNGNHCEHAGPIHPGGGLDSCGTLCCGRGSPCPL